ncbi:hypothetical protein MNBD_GAMMA07-1626 [hydrothermal vent metagenome]|uniref:Nitric oxide-responding transcriptional regulator Dnr (Crp/Fnr family) n=1 Tax=hydrothermal vent metagenome TaxID=652676 RepID=A0A3B0XDH0_9ZZZZ
MKSVIRTATIILFFIACFEVKAIAAKAIDVKEMADICMYSERLLKDYALVGMNVTYGDPAKDLIKNAKIVNQYLADIESHHLDAALDKEVKEIHRLWSKIEIKLLKTPDKSSMLALRHDVEIMVKKCEIVAEHLAKSTGNAAEHDVVLIAELGMESQRLGALYMLKAWGVDDDKYEEEVAEIIKEFKDIENELLNANEKLVSAEVKKQIKSMDNHFRVLSVLAQTAGKTGRFAPTRFERSTSKVFNEIREILELERHNVE